VNPDVAVRATENVLVICWLSWGNSSGRSDAV
jgi:hypothetical protein